MNKVWYAWNGTFARSSILNYWTYSRNSKEAGEESSLRSSRISFKKFTLIKELSLLKVKAIGNILKVLFLLWWWDKMRSKVHQNHFLLSQVICNLLYIHRYRGLSSIDRFVLITKSSSILLSIPRLFFFICSALRRIQLRGSIDTAFCIWDIRTKPSEWKKQQFTRPIEHSFSCLHHIYESQTSAAAWGSGRRNPLLQKEAWKGHFEDFQRLC